MEERAEFFTPHRSSMLSQSASMFEQLTAPDIGCRFVSHQVRIIPEKMVFSDAFDGKHFTKSFTIINCGKYPVVVRIMSSSSQAIKLKFLKKGQYLPSGLSVTRTIRYVHTNVMAVNKACIFLYVNDDPVTYNIEVQLIAAYIKVTPHILNFGEIDVGNASPEMTVQLENVGHRLAAFSIDLGRNDLELIVEPMKGNIMPDEIVKVTVEVLGSHEGEFCREFWIKTEPPKRVKLTGVFIMPKLVVEFPIPVFNFTMVDFPKTYYGAKNSRTVVICNNSSNDRMYCLTFECGLQTQYLRQAKKSNDNLRFFQFNHLEGRLLAKKVSILRITFAPYKYELFKNQHCQAFIRVESVNYRDGIVPERDDVVKTFSLRKPTTSEEILSTPMDLDNDFEDIEMQAASFIRLCLYGELEQAAVKICPEGFTLNYLEVNETYDRILHIKNLSEHLPILIKTNPIPGIVVTPSELFLGPTESMEVTISITPPSGGTKNYKIIFSLFHREGRNEYKVGMVKLPIEISATLSWTPVEPKFHMGITPKVTNEVGFLVDDIRYNSKAAMPRQAIVDKNFCKFNKDNNDLIAFPNDRPRCLRPWRNDTPCRAIFSNLPRVVTRTDTYALTEEERLFKLKNQKKYSDYISKAAKRKSVIRANEFVNPDYEVANSSHVLMENMHLPPETYYSQPVEYGRIPLPPEKLMEVKIYPKYVYLGKIAPYTTCTDSFCIENKNSFPIHVSIKALSNSVVIKEKRRIVIEGRKTKHIFFDCISHGFGKFYVPVYIIINDNHIFDGTVFASVVPTTVRCDYKEIVINPKTHRSFFELYNPVNCDIRFSWEIQDENFMVVPASGVIKSRKAVYCSIMFIPQIEATYRSELYLHSASGAKQVITAVCMNERATLGFSSKKILFDNIPLNITVKKSVVLRNFSDEEIMYLVQEPKPMDEITVSPAVGKLNAKSDVAIFIRAHFEQVVSFDCNVTFVLQDNYNYTINISGNVVFPMVSISPESLQIPKVPLNCFQRHTIKIKNTSEATNMITFHMGDIPEFTVTDTQKNPINGVTLEPNELREMILEFRPTEPIAYSLYLPYVMNNFIGPPVLNDPTTLRSENYFKREGVTFNKPEMPYPKHLKTLNIRCASSGQWFHFSSLHIAFHHEVNVKSKKRFTITNVSKSEHSITIPFIDKRYPFVVRMEKSHSTKQGKAWKFQLAVGESVTMKIDFHPLHSGSYKAEMPFYVAAYSKNLPFNCVKLLGEYVKPVITCNITYLYFPSILTKERLNKKITLQFDYHRKDCKVEVQFAHKALSFKLLKRVEKVDPGKVSQTSFDSTVEYLIKFAPKQQCIVHTMITFTCSCNTSYTMKLKACADNSIFSSYQSVIRMRAVKEGQEFESPFPFFPKTTDNSYYAKNVKAVKEDMEGWLFSQAFFYKAFYKIPYGLASLPVEIKHTLPDGVAGKRTIKKPGSKHLKNAGTLNLPLVQLLINLINPKVTKYLYEGLPDPCYEGLDGVIYTHALYKNILHFLEVQGVFVTQMKAEHMLPYSHYVVFMEEFATDPNEKDNIFSEEDFLYFSKQAWLDLILRIYRVFVFSRTTTNLTDTTQTPLIYEVELQEYYEENCSRFGEEVNETERKLLLWLEFHFQAQSTRLWEDKTNKKFSNRKIRCFGTDMVDGLPFVTLMAAYCPYMMTCFPNIFPRANTEEEMYHNACIIYETWKRMRLSYDLRPIRIVKPSATEMEILTSYLYVVLPNFYPSETLTFNTSLGDECRNMLVVKNRGDAVIAYTPLFFNNDTDAFTLDVDILIIEPGGERSITVSYNAKSILKKTAVLVLSGETIGYKFAKTMAFNLVGIPNIFQALEEFSIKTEMFRPTKTMIELTSPFKLAYDARICFYLGDRDKTPETLEDFVSVSKMIAQRSPRQIVFDPECKFDDAGCCTLKLNLCFVASGLYTYFFYFINKDVGDFCITINVQSTLKDSKALHLPVSLPRLFSTDVCTCGHNWDVRCPRIIPIDLPSRNEQMMEGLGLLFLNCFDEEEYNFWRKLLSTPKGLHVLKEYLDNTFPNLVVKFSPIFQQKVTYDISIHQRKKMSIPDTVTVEDTTSNQTITIYVHWNSNEIPVKELLTLTASHGKEVRKYVLDFGKFEQKLIACQY